MAIDTRDKRASAVAMLMPWLVAPMVPDGSIDGTDKQHVVGVYRGIGSVPPTLIVGQPRLSAGTVSSLEAGIRARVSGGYRQILTAG